MRFYFLGLTCVLLLCGCASLQGNTNRKVASDIHLVGLPTLNEIKTVVLEASYSCNGSYEKSAVFLSKSSKESNAPDLLYRGTCRAGNYIDASTAGDDFSLIADLGNVSLKKLTPSKMFNFENTVGRDNTFKGTAEIKLNHVYAVLSSQRDLRSLVAYKVVNHQRNGGTLTLNYAVKSYSIQKPVKIAPGWGWERQSSLSSPAP